MLDVDVWIQKQVSMCFRLLVFVDLATVLILLLGCQFLQLCLLTGVPQPHPRSGLMFHLLLKIDVFSLQTILYAAVKSTKTAPFYIVTLNECCQSEDLVFTVSIGSEASPNDQPRFRFDWVQPVYAVYTQQSNEAVAFGSIVRLSQISRQQ